MWDLVARSTSGDFLSLTLVPEIGVISLLWSMLGVDQMPQGALGLVSTETALGLKSGPLSLAEQYAFTQQYETRLPKWNWLAFRWRSYWTQNKFRVLDYQRWPWALGIVVCVWDGLFIGSHFSLFHLRCCLWSIDPQACKGGGNVLYPVHLHQEVYPTPLQRLCTLCWARTLSSEAFQRCSTKPNGPLQSMSSLVSKW